MATRVPREVAMIPSSRGTLTHTRYAAGSVLGRGGQGIVMRVEDREAPTRALVAKVFRPGLFSENLLLGEFALLSRLRVAGLVCAHDLSRDERTGAPFLVEDFVDGPDARQWLHTSPLDQRLTRLKVLISGVASTLSALHEAGFVHGDLKPAHVRIEEGRPMLLDLGAAISHRSIDGRAGGPAHATAITRAYAAPEIVAGAAPTPSSDLYALGALVWGIVAPGPRKPRGSSSLRDYASWIPPSLDDLVSQLLSAHPLDRPEGARDVIALMADSSGADSDAPGIVRMISAVPLGRERDLATLFDSTERVLYVCGDAGIGKSQLMQELVTRRLLLGADTRLVRFPALPHFVTALVEFFRGASSSLPFRPKSERDLLLVLDELERAPEELRGALEAFRCRTNIDRPLRVIAAVRSAPDGAPSLPLRKLGDGDIDALCRSFGEHRSDRRTELVRMADGNPSWLLSALGRMPLGTDAVHEKVRTLGEPARRLLGSVALLGGEMPWDLAIALLAGDAPTAVAELAACGLLNRRGALSEESTPLVVLTAPAQAVDLASALASFDLADHLAQVLLDDARWASDLLLSVALGPHPPARRSSLLRAAADRARIARLRSLETDALLALAADPEERTPELLRKLERLTRGVAGSASHPHVLSWIIDAAARHPSIETFALRRRADDLARRGRYDDAAELLAQAVRTAQLRADRIEEALASAAQGAVALYRGDFKGARRPIEYATALLDGTSLEDEEEIARLHHNAGIVAMYEERTEDAVSAFTASIERKRSLGDRGGVSACLLNLGLALSKLARFEEAANALDEAIALARSVGRVASVAWCFAARAEIEIRRGDGRAAERWIAEAECMTAELPAPVKADLASARAEAALLRGDADGALTHLKDIGSDVRQEDALADARASLLEARARLAQLPVDRRLAARLAMAAIKTARREGFLEVERNAIDVLRSARRSKRESPLDMTAQSPAREVTAMMDADVELWQWLEAISSGVTSDEMASELARLIVQESRAERAFIVFADAGNTNVVGVDMDGLPLVRCEERIDHRFVEEALRGSGPLYQPDYDSSAGSGSRLAIAAARHGSDARRAVIVLEHRFARGCFDGLQSALVRKWSILANVADRLRASRSQSKSDEDAAAVLDDASAIDEPSTSLPLPRERRHFPTLIGSSPSFKAALSRLERCVDSELPVLILGETGVGKELFARAMHEHGTRKSRPFVALNCGAIPENLVEAELFGHERGAFTGAERARVGLIAKAEGGTLFLDEIGELPLSKQAALLRAIESRRYRSVGGDVERTFDVRLVTATNRDLERAVRDGAFRGDLLYRINVLQITVPPLRQRKEDVTVLANHFLAQSGSPPELTVDALTALEAYEWPGNVRELEHHVLRLLNTGLRRIEPRHLPRQIRGALRKRKGDGRRAAAPSDREKVERALTASSGNITHAAKVLGLTRHGLKKRMVRLGMRELAKRGAK